ncbi:MAG TPA: UbiA family prenyltransferase [Polyangiaceae bacterium]|nr:UbiA family prenyltransferase [Polyangiaceae bacterium]
MPLELSFNQLDEAVREAGPSARPLCVAFDGTVITTRVLSERMALLFRRRPWAALALPVWMLGGRDRLRARLAAMTKLDATSLPYRAPLINALKLSRASGRRVVLATATDLETAEEVAEYLGVFDEVCAATSTAGRPKVKARNLREALQSAYPDGFDFIGQSHVDLPILEVAERGFIVGASPSTAQAAKRLQRVTVVSRRPSILLALVKELRPHQWAKNALVLLPCLLANNVAVFSMFARGAVAAATFSLCASAGYVFNDLLDLEADRIHPSKAKRPFASGALPIIFGFPLFIALLAMSFLLATAFLPVAFSAMLLAYFVGTVSYSLYLKRLLMLDVLVLAALYTHRIVSGGIATAVPVSAWLLGFSMFFFTSLAFAKRFVELHALDSNEKVKNRGYFRVDLPMVTAMGTASGYIAALVFMLYVESSAVRVQYREPAVLWLVLPALLYWLGRIWLLAGRGQMQEDPVKFALRDRQSLVCVAIVALIAALARFTPDWLIGALH